MDAPIIVQGGYDIAPAAPECRGSGLVALPGDRDQKATYAESHCGEYDAARRQQSHCERRLQMSAASQREDGAGGDQGRTQRDGGASHDGRPADDQEDDPQECGSSRPPKDDWRTAWLRHHQLHPPQGLLDEPSEYAQYRIHPQRLYRGSGMGEIQKFDPG